MQFSLFEKRPLFDDETLLRREQEWRAEVIPDFEDIKKAATDFIKQVQLRRGSEAKETTLEQEFNRAFFRDLLGYTLYPGVDDAWGAWPKPPTSSTGLSGEPDLLLGNFGPDACAPVVVVELKRPGTKLDAPQPGYGGKSPVEQAFQYARKLPSCNWVCVTDMRLFRLYSIESDSAFHEVDLWTDRRPLDSILRECWHLLARPNLVEDPDDAPTLRLLHSSQERQFDFREGFYRIYSEIRADILKELQVSGPTHLSREEYVQAAQRLLDRFLFIHFCEDHPDRLLPRHLLRDLVDRSVRQPGPATNKAYEGVKGLFRDLDLGVDTQYWKIPRYNGELFKHHPIVDEVSLPDELHSKSYTWTSNDGRVRRNVQGIYGLHIFDFWKELDRDLLGNVFEKSIGDLTDMAIGVGGRPDARSAFGIYYTASRLAEFAAASTINMTLEEDVALRGILSQASEAGDRELRDLVSSTFNLLKDYKIADLACGSGVFLTTALDALLGPYRKMLEAGTVGPLSRELQATRQSELLRSCIFGDDLLPQAVELAKLALWLTAARKGESSADLTANFTVGDALTTGPLEILLSNAGGAFRAVVGNPPWGAEINEGVRESADGGLDSWELFLKRVFDVLEEGGRLGLLIPDTFFSSAKAPTRRWLVENTTIEKVYLLGPDWFGSAVRMSTVFLQVKKARPSENHRIRTLLLAGLERQRALNGKRPLDQAEESGSGWFLQSRARLNDEANISVLVSDDELPLLEKIEACSVPLGSIALRGRGEEMSADGSIWRCGSCGTRTVPGEKAKGGGYKDKDCPICHAILSYENAQHECLVSPTQGGPFNTPYIDGLALTRRYQNPARRFMRTDLEIVPSLKAAATFGGPKILIRQAGVGITATLVEGDDRFPQSIYTYRPTGAAAEEGYTPEFLLGCLCSRVMNFLHMKRSGEVDPARAFAKLTHARLSSFPIPILNSDRAHELAAEIVKDVKSMLNLQQYGRETDWRIERRLQELWGISPNEGRYINGFFSRLPAGQALSDLFPDGPPPPVPFPSAGD